METTQEKYFMNPSLWAKIFISNLVMVTTMFFLQLLHVWYGLADWYAATLKDSFTKEIYFGIESILQAEFPALNRPCNTKIKLLVLGVLELT